MIAVRVRDENGVDSAQTRIRSACNRVAGIIEEAHPCGILEQDRTVLGAEPKHYRKNAFNDTIRFAERGIAAVTFGPGEDGWPPFNEYIRIGKSVAATKILALAVMDLLEVVQ